MRFELGERFISMLDQSRPIPDSRRRLKSIIKVIEDLMKVRVCQKPYTEIFQILMKVWHSERNFTEFHVTYSGQNVTCSVSVMWDISVITSANLIAMDGVIAQNHIYDNTVLFLQVNYQRPVIRANIICHIYHEGYVSKSMIYGKCKYRVTMPCEPERDLV